jgi:hypothetical protein
MTLYWKHLLICAGLCVGGQASAAGFLYDCSITEKGARMGWLSDKLAFVVPGDGKIQVIDAVTLNFRVSPLTVKVTRNTDTKLVMRWALKGVRDSNGLQVPTFDYTARINKETLGITLEANPRGFSKNWVGRGSCVKRTK